MAIVMGTAGHIDHGKTSLVRKLTGIDCNRLEEEKRRGITIELGFAHIPTIEVEPTCWISTARSPKMAVNAALTASNCVGHWPS